MKAAFTLCLLAISLALAGCNAKLVRADGPYLLIGPADAPISEITLPDTDSCEYMLAGYRTGQIAECKASSAALPFEGTARNEFWGVNLPVTGRTLTACTDILSRLAKQRGWALTAPCKQVREPISAVQTAPPETPAKKKPTKPAPVATQSSPAL